MLNLMKADLYRTRHRLYYFLVLMVPLAMIGCLLFFSCFILKPSAYQSGDAANMIGLVMQLYPGLGAWMVLLMADVTFSDEHRYGTLKNTISYGYSRVAYYFSKMLTGLLLSLVALVSLLAVSYMLFWLIVGGSGQDVMGMVKLTFEQLLYALPLWVGFLSMAIAILTNIRNNTGCAVLFALLLILPKNLLAIMGQMYPSMAFVYEFLPSTRLEIVSYMSWGPGDLAVNWLIGLAFTVITTGIGLSLFQKKEIK